MKPIVIDPSIAATWTLDDEKTETSDKILHEVKSAYPITPALFWHEYRNILVSNVRRGRVSADSIFSLLQGLRDIGIETQVTEDDHLIISLAIHHNLTAYDAAYLALAINTDAILSTNDRKLARAAIAVGLELRSALNSDLF